MKESLFGIAAKTMAFAALGTGIARESIPHLPKQQQAQARVALAHIGVGFWAIGESQSPYQRGLLKDCMTESACSEPCRTQKTWYSQEFGIEKRSVEEEIFLQSVQNKVSGIIQACLFKDGSSILETKYPLQELGHLAREANTRVVAVIRSGDCWAIPQSLLEVGNQ